MERKIWKPVINILKEMAPEKNEPLTFKKKNFACALWQIM